MDNFFYNLNDKLNAIRATPEVTHQQLNERDMSRAAKGYEKYGKQGMEALAKAGREGKALDPVRKKYDKYDNKQVDEGGEVINGVYKLAIEPKRPEEEENKMTRGTRPRTAAPGFGKDDYKPLNPDAMKKGSNSMGTIKGGVFSADPPKRGEKGVPVPMDLERVPEAGAPMTPKQKSFAKLAPPANKITFADKIANAKKEVDEMLGDVAAEAMRSALSPKQQKMAALGGDPERIDARDLEALRKGADMGEERSKGTAFDMNTPRASTPKVGSVERGSKHDIKHTATGRMVTRRTDAQGNSVGADDDSDTQAGPRGRGRPKGTKGAIGAKGPSGKSKLMTKEGEVDIRDQGEYDQEGDMAKDTIKTVMRHAQALNRVLGDNDNLPEWVQSKLAKIESMMVSVDEYMQNQEGDDEEEPIAEKAVSKKQQRFMGMVHSAQQGKKPASKAVGKVANTMKKSDAEDFAKTKHKGLPEKAKKKEVDETSEEGRITTTRTGPGKTLTTSSTGRVSATIGNGKISVKPGKSDKQMDDNTDTASAKDSAPSKANSMVGKGIYDSMNRELELMIAESMSINMSDSTEGNKSLTVTATDEDAMKLAMILKSAGLGGHGGDMHSSGEQPCATCGMPDCGCGDVQEAVDDNAPDYPTNTEQADNNFGYAGGLNKPKADVAGNGQSTVPVVATRPHNDDDLRRMMEMAGLAEAAKPDFLDLDKDGNKKESMKDAADDVNEEDTVEESMHRMREAAGIKIKNNLGPTSPDIARMSKDEVNSALRSGMNSKVDLGPTSPDIARMSKDEVDAALRSGMSPDISNMDPDSVNAEFNKEDRQYEDSMQRMREMAGIKEAKKEVDEEKTDEGNKFAFNVIKAKAAGKKEADLDGDGDMEKVRESIFALTNQWQAYKG